MLNLYNFAKAALDANKHSRVPHRNQTRGAAILASTGAIFEAGNVEMPSARFSVCAETLAICDMLRYGSNSIQLMAIVGDGDEPISPCGICRQMMASFPTFSLTMYNFDGTKSKTMTNKELLPDAY